MSNTGSFVDTVMSGAFGQARTFRLAKQMKTQYAVRLNDSKREMIETAKIDSAN